MWMVVGVLGKKINTLCVIPARYNSSRFRGKPLVKIDGIPMIKRTYIQAQKSKLLDDIVVATDDGAIFDFCVSEKINVVMTSDECLTGTDRVAEVVNKKAYESYDFYINIQGDEPVIDPCVIDQLVNEYIEHGDRYIAYNLYKVIDLPEIINSNTIIKVIVNELNELLYMSRLPVPYSNTNLHSIYRMQIPAYGYTTEALQVFSDHNKTVNERFEDIELLRFVDLGYRLKMIETNATSIAVDMPHDVIRVEEYLISSKI